MCLPGTNSETEAGMHAFCIRVPGFASQLCSQLRLPVNMRLTRRKGRAQVAESLPPMWETPEQVLGSRLLPGLAQPRLSQAFGE